MGSLPRTRPHRRSDKRAQPPAPAASDGGAEPANVAPAKAGPAKARPAKGRAAKPSAAKAGARKAGRQRGRRPAPGRGRQGQSRPEQPWRHAGHPRQRRRRRTAGHPDRAPGIAPVVGSPSPVGQGRISPTSGVQGRARRLARPRGVTPGRVRVRREGAGCSGDRRPGGRRADGDRPPRGRPGTAPDALAAVAVTAPPRAFALAPSHPCAFTAAPSHPCAFGRLRRTRAPSRPPGARSSPRHERSRR